MSIITFSEVDVVKIQGSTRHGRPLYLVEKDICVSFLGLPFHTIRKGFITDKTSWPRTMTALLGWTPLVKRWVTDPERKYEAPAILHDDLLQNTKLPKWAVDMIYKMALRSSMVSAIEAWLFGSAVRIKRSR